MKYEFHIGDYVETKDGVVGYIINVSIEDKGDVLLIDIQYPGGVGHNMITMDDLPYFLPVSVSTILRSLKLRRLRN